MTYGSCFASPSALRFSSADACWSTERRRKSHPISALRKFIWAKRAMPELLVVDRLTAGYGDSTVLEDISFCVDEGDSLALLGRNGVGKTTLLVTLMGFTTVRAGSMRWHGRDLARLPTHRRANA